MNLTDLETLIPQYAENKIILDDYKKLCEKENAKIKEVMKSFTLDHFESGEYKATYSVSQRESIDEEILISLFQTVPAFTEIANKYEIIKSKPYIDFDALEKALYEGALSNEQIADLDKAKETKTVETLRISKIKVKGGEE